MTAGSRYDLGKGSCGTLRIIWLLASGNVDVADILIFLKINTARKPFVVVLLFTWGAVNGRSRDSS